MAGLAQQLGGTLAPSAVVDEEFDTEATAEVLAEAQALYDNAREDMNLLAALCMPSVFVYPFPKVFLAMWQWLTSYAHIPRIFPRLAVGLPRGFSKTTVIKLFILYCIFYTKKQYILVIGAIPELAEKILADVVDILGSDNVRHVYGDFNQNREVDRNKFQQFWFRGRLIVLQAIGEGTAIRGANVNGRRPDVIIFDDIQKREDSNSDQLAEALKDWFQNTALKLRDPNGCMYIFLGNMYPTKHAMLKWLNAQPTWIKFITGAILADGTSLWEQLFPIKQLLEEYAADCAAGMKDSFMAELMNDGTANLNTSLDITRIAPYKNPFGFAPQGNFIIIDPATGKKGKDAVGIGYFEVLEDKPVLCDLVLGALSPGDQVREALALAAKYNCRLVVVEAVAYQETLLYWFNQFAEQLGLSGTIMFEPIYPGTRSKNARIIEMFQAWMAGEIAVSELCWNQALSQATSFDPRRTDNTDEILDLLHYAPKVKIIFEDYLAAQVLESINAIPMHEQRDAVEMSSF